MPYRSIRWATPFGRWVGRVGVERVAELLTVRGIPTSPRAVYHWISGRSSPSLAAAICMERLSRHRVTCSQIECHRQRLQALPRAEVAARRLACHVAVATVAIGPSPATSRVRFVESACHPVSRGVSHRP